jgi:hypothetical protein
VRRGIAITPGDYPIRLDEEGRATADFPSAEGKATLLFLDALRVTRIEQVGSVEDLRRVLEPQPAR